jgi:hypothetical protein
MWWPNTACPSAWPAVCSHSTARRNARSLSDVFILRGVPGHVRSDNGPEFIAKAVQAWITAAGAQTAYIPQARHGRTATSRASTRSSGTSSSMARSSTRSRRRGSSRGLAEALQTIRSHSSLGYIPPAPRSRYGRLRNPDQLRRPHNPSRSGRQSTNLQLGPPDGGRPTGTRSTAPRAWQGCIRRIGCTPA